jgi:hypothetical protein
LSQCQVVIAICNDVTRDIAREVHARLSDGGAPPSTSEISSISISAPELQTASTEPPEFSTLPAPRQIARASFRPQSSSMLMQFAAAHPGIITSGTVTFGFMLFAAIFSIVLAPGEDF